MYAMLLHHVKERTLYILTHLILDFTVRLCYCNIPNHRGGGSENKIKMKKKSLGQYVWMHGSTQ